MGRFVCTEGTVGVFMLKLANVGVNGFLNIQPCVCVCVFFYSNFPFRYKLLRRKTNQPLAITTVPTLTAQSPPPSEDLHRWLHVYSGTKLFYQDKGLSR